MEKSKPTSAAADTQPVQTAKHEKPESEPAGFYCYIGPSVLGLIQHGAVYRGTKKNALAAMSAAIEKYPLIKNLVVSGEKLPEARLKVKKPGNALYINYQRVAGKS